MSSINVGSTILVLPKTTCKSLSVSGQACKVPVPSKAKPPVPIHKKSKVDVSQIKISLTLSDGDLTHNLTRQEYLTKEI